jgi:hypothetical protein
MTLAFVDTETCGLTGPAVTIQYAYDNGPISVHDIWLEPVSDTLHLIEELLRCDVVGFNLAFDIFQLAKIYNMLTYLPGDAYPEDHIEELAEYEPLARDGLCLKPKRACDLMCHARKTKYQSTMDRKDIVIKRVPTVLAFRLAELLEKKIELSDIYFARRKDKFAPKWKVVDIEANDDFKNVVLSFRASSSLKALAVDALKLDDVAKFSDVEMKPEYFPIEAGWAPFAKAISSKESGWYGEIKKGNKLVKGFTWPRKIRFHIDHWKYYQRARKYAEDDVHYTRGLYEYFERPEPGDNDSELACMVAVVRWKGYAIDIPKLTRQREEAIKLAKSVPTAPKQVRAYIYGALSEPEKLVLQGSTKKEVLEAIAKWQAQQCIACGGTKCIVCDFTGTLTHPAAERAKHVLEARTAAKHVDLYNKLLMAGRFHASFNVIGTLSSRMSGSDGLNPQGIPGKEKVRSCFPFTTPGLDVLCGGDFDSFEVVIAVATYKDPDLEKELLTCDDCDGLMLANDGPPRCVKCHGLNGKKIHALFGVNVFTDMTYEQIKKDKVVYTNCKRAVFAMLYGGEGFTLASRLNVPIEVAEAAHQRFLTTYRRVGAERERVIQMFQSMQQEGGIGTRIVWKEPAERIESLFGFPRYFTLENLITKSLFELANNPPKEWRKVQVKVQRRDDRIQTAGGAVQSAIYAAAFAIQASNTRAAANHVIQSSGAQITKTVQRRIWDVQPAGVHPWRTQPCNIHDEILAPTHPDYVGQVRDAVNNTVESFRPQVPLISMKWRTDLKTWADK